MKTFRMLFILFLSNLLQVDAQVTTLDKNRRLKRKNE